jgi:hypothetical protein
MNYENDYGRKHSVEDTKLLSQSSLADCIIHDKSKIFIITTLQLHVEVHSWLSIRLFRFATGWVVLIVDHYLCMQVFSTQVQTNNQLLIF